MKTVVFRAHLLLGDALYACATIGRYAREHSDERIVVECLDEYPQEVYRWIPGVELTYATDTVCDVRYTFDPTAAMHAAAGRKPQIPIWQAMGDILKLPTDPKPVLSIPEMEIPEAWKGAFVISPFSRSCTSHTLGNDGKPLPANKVLPIQTWMPVIRYLRRRGKVLFVSARHERIEGFQMDESERVAGYPLSVVASVFRSARVVFSLDNGLARLSTLVGAKTIIMMPEFLPLPVFSPVPWSPDVFIAQTHTAIDPIGFAVAMKAILQQKGWSTTQS